MSNILADIVEEVNIKPKLSKLILKWVITIATSTIVIAFAFGQIKAMRVNRLDNFERILDENTAAMVDLRTEMKAGFENVSARFDKVYDDGYKAFNDFQIYNNKQLGLIIDYGSSNKDLLKRMLEVNTMEKTKNVESNIEQAKNTPPLETNIVVRPIKNIKENKGYISLVQIVAVGTNDTTFKLVGATKEFINNIDRNRYSVGAVIENQENPKLYDVNYMNKK
jgi:hypothetical protein